MNWIQVVDITKNGRQSLPLPQKMSHNWGLEIEMGHCHLELVVSLGARGAQSQQESFGRLSNSYQSMNQPGGSQF